VTYVVLFILAVVWAVYLVSWLRSRSETRKVDSISSFNRHLSILERTAPGGPTRSSAPASRAPGLGLGAPPMVRRPVLSPAKKRRKDILTGLLAATGITLLGGLFIGGMFRLLFVASLLLTVGYVALLVSAQRRVLEHRTKVRRLATPMGVPVQGARVRPAAWSEDWRDAEARDGDRDSWADDDAAGYAAYGYADERYVAARS
jgi:hypothetical protein